MAHFAELDENNIVKRVVVVGNDIPANGGTLEDNDMHVDGETWCQNFFKGGTWKQTSYNHNFRKQYAGPGFKYDSTKDKFIAPQPYGSWTLNSDDDWEAPITRPSESDCTFTEGDDTHYWVIDWDESAYQADNTKGWKAFKSNDASEALHDWNGTTWVAV